MSLQADSMKNVWKEHRDQLTRIKTQLHDGQSPIKSPARSPVVRSPGGGSQGGRSPAAGTGHSPYGRYRQSTPPYLPRIETPPDHDARKSQSKIRGNRYELVPPVRDSRRYESRNDDYDSWGEESDEESEADPGHYLPQPYPYPVQSYPYSHPPPGPAFVAPYPLFYPPPPPPRRKNPKRQQREHRDENDYQAPRRSMPSPSHARPPLRERYEEVNRSEPRHSKKRQTRVHFDQPAPAQNGYYGYPVYPYPNAYGGEERKPKKDSKYKYIHPRDTPFSPNTELYNRFKDDPERIMLLYMKDHPLFSDGFINAFVNQTVDELIPDLLIDVVKEAGHMPGSGFSVLDEVRDDILREELPYLIHGVVKSTLNELVNEHMLYTQSDRDPLEGFLNKLLGDVVQEASSEIVKESIREMAHDYVKYKHHEVAFDDLLDDFLDEIGADLVEDAMVDMIGEDFIRDVVIEEELAEEVPEVAKQVLSHYDTKVMRREMKEVSSQAGDKLIETFMLDYLMTLLARQGKVWSESDLANKYMDDMLTDILLSRMFEVTTQRRKTLKNSPVRRLHQKAVTDVALDVLLQQLSASLDEDLQDVDEYEKDIPEDYPYKTNTPVSIKLGHSH